jgi:membrane fusion protein
VPRCAFTVRSINHDLQSVFALSRWFSPLFGVGRCFGLAMSIFREQVIAAKNSQSLGRMTLPRTRMALPIMVFFAVIVVSFALVLMFASTARKERASGRLLPSEGLLNVRAGQDAVVSALLVREGETVTQGQALAELAFDRVSRLNEDAAIGDALAQQLEKQRLQLMDDQLALLGNETGRKRDIKVQIATTEKRLALLNTQYRLKQQQYQQAKALWQRMELLDKSSLSLLQLQQYENAMLSADSARTDIALQQLSTESELAELRLGVDTNSGQFAERNSALARAVAENAQARARNAGERTMLILAPRAGTVSALGVYVGQSVTGNARLLDIIPTHTALIAELWVPARAIGTLQTRTAVLMRLDAFPYQRFGALKAQIQAIAATPSPAAEIAERTGLRLSDPAYRVTLTLGTQHMLLDQKNYALRAGMTVQSDLLLERRTLLQAFFARRETAVPVAPQNAVRAL